MHLQSYNLIQIESKKILFCFAYDSIVRSNVFSQYDKYVYQKLVKKKMLR